MSRPRKRIAAILLLAILALPCSVVAAAHLPDGCPRVTAPSSDPDPILYIKACGGMAAWWENQLIHAEEVTQHIRNILAAQGLPTHPLAWGEPFYTERYGIIPVLLDGHWVMSILTHYHQKRAYWELESGTPAKFLKIAPQTSPYLPVRLESSGCAIYPYLPNGSSLFWHSSIYLPEEASTFGIWRADYQNGMRSDCALTRAINYPFLRFPDKPADPAAALTWAGEWTDFNTFGLDSDDPSLAKPAPAQPPPPEGEPATSPLPSGWWVCAGLVGLIFGYSGQSLVSRFKMKKERLT